MNAKQLRFTRQISICHRCSFSQTRRGGCAGPCPCHIDGRDIIDHAQANYCPVGLFPDADLHVEGGTPPPIQNPAPAEGPGTELKKLLAKIGIHASPNCACNAMADQMNREGGAWCLENIEIIVEMMRSEAAKRKLPFVSTVARMMVRRAVRKAAESTAMAQAEPRDSYPPMN